MRLPWTIWLHVLSELWRLLLITTSVLVLVTSFAITLRYTSEGKLGPLDTLRFMGLAAVPMLQYVLPFAAGFAATLAYHRMTQDNELTAAKASGVSHRALLVPALSTGLLLAVVLALLNGIAIPRFLRAMEQMIAQDAAKMVANTIEAGEPLEIGHEHIYADQVYHLSPEPAPGDSASPYEVLLLTGILAIETGARGEVTSDMTASQAIAGFFAMREGDNAHGHDAGGLTMLSLDLKNPSGLGRLNRGNAGTVHRYIPIQGVFNDNPKYLTNRELRELPQHPESLNVIDARRRILAVRLAEADTAATINRTLRASGSISMEDEAGRTFDLRAAGLRGPKPRWELVPPASGKPIEVEVFSLGPDGRTDPAARIHFDCKTAGLKSGLVNDSAAPNAKRVTLTLELEEVSSHAREGDPAGERLKKIYGGLSLKPDPLAELIDRTPAQLLAESDRRLAPGPRRPASESERGYISEPARDLRERLAKLGREVVSKLHERAAMAVACLVMVLTGALTAMRLAGSLPLTVYLWSFFPALACVITVSAGQNVAIQLGTGGLILLWGGVVALSAYAAGAFWLVRKH